jgi:hypothetical protein
MPKASNASGASGTESESQSTEAHAICQDCSWFAIPDHQIMDVSTATEQHTRKEGHTATVGFSDGVVNEAKKRARGEVTKGGE